MHERALLNGEAAIVHLAARGFEPGRASVGRQAVRFAQARAVVGIAGAAMANTVFCAPGTRLLYLRHPGLTPN